MAGSLFIIIFGVGTWQHAKEEERIDADMADPVYSQTPSERNSGDCEINLLNFVEQDLQQFCSL